jgi:folate-dependent phosphoribosylglycinamide formyltransferase PurN
MRFGIFTKRNDVRLPYILERFRSKGVEIALIVIAESKVIKLSLKGKIAKLIRRKNEFNVSNYIKEFNHVYVKDHNSNDTMRCLYENEIDFVFLSSAGILKPSVINGNWKIINCHPAILPRYRGKGSPIWAIYEEGSTGVTAHLVDSGIDTGPIIHREYVNPLPDETIHNFRKRLDFVSIDVMCLIAKKIIDRVGIYTEIQKPEEGVLYRRKPLNSELPYIIKVFERTKIKRKNNGH